jgi:hypothetical protein
MPTSASTLKFFRLTHRYIGLFIAPALMFFALTGALQTLSLHEGAPGSSYKAPAWIATLAQIHKNHELKKPKPPATGPKDDKPKADKPAQARAPDVPAAPLTAMPTAKWKMHTPLKIFFLLVALGLFTSTLTGIYMSYRYGGSKIAVTVLLLAGIVVPPLLLKF